MIKFAPYISLYDLNEKFEFEREVIWTFSKNLIGISSQRQRFNIHLVNEKSEERKWLDGSIKSIWKYFDQSRFLNIDSKLVKELILMLIKDSFMDVSHDLGWDTEVISKAYEKSIAENIEFYYKSKPKFNKSKLKSGLIEISLEGEKATIWGILLDKKQSVLNKTKMIETFPDEIDWWRTFRSYKWINENKFGFELKNGITLTISENSDKAIWNHNNSEEDLKFIKSIIYRDFKSDDDLVEWMNT